MRKRSHHKLQKPERQCCAVMTFDIPQIEACTMPQFLAFFFKVVKPDLSELRMSGDLLCSINDVSEASTASGGEHRVSIDEVRRPVLGADNRSTSPSMGWTHVSYAWSSFFTGWAKLEEATWRLGYDLAQPCEEVSFGFGLRWYLLPSWFGSTR